MTWQDEENYDGSQHKDLQLGIGENRSAGGFIKKFSFANDKYYGIILHWNPLANDYMKIDQSNYKYDNLDGLQMADITGLVDEIL